jgi:nucleotide-binding universal stress UspA family protein
MNTPSNSSVPMQRSPQAMHFLLAVDGSEPSTRAAQWLATLAQTQLALRCTALYVQHPLMAGEVSALAPAYITLDQREQEAALALTQISTLLESAGVAHTTQTCTGDAVETLLSHAQSLGADALVVGRRGHGALRAALLGSVSSKVVQGAQVPVIVVGENTPVAASAGQVGDRPLKVLLALDGFPNALRAADFAAKLVQQSGGELHTVHVRPTFTLIETLLSTRQHLLEYWADHDANAALAAPRQLMQNRGLAIHEHASISDAPDQAIGQLAAELACELVVMGTRGLNPLSASIMGSVSQGVLTQANVAVALVK